MVQSSYRISSATSMFHYGNKESDSAIVFLDILVIRKEPTLATKVYGKPTHTGDIST
jgi:hypothetical protein